MKKILFTRAIDMAYKSILHNAGFEVLEYNFLKTASLPSAQADILNELPNFKNLVFTSQHAVHIFFECIKPLNLAQQLASGFKPDAGYASYLSILSLLITNSKRIDCAFYLPFLSSKIQATTGIWGCNWSIHKKHLIAATASMKTTYALA